MRPHSAARLFTPRALRKTASMRRVSGTTTPCARKAYSREIVSQAWRKSCQVFRSAQALMSSFVTGHLSDASFRTAGSLRAASRATGECGSRAHQKGEQTYAEHAFSFASSRPVTQLVIRLNFSEGAALEEHPMQREFPLLARMEGPHIVPPELMRTIKTYREAVRLCWALRRLRPLTFRQLAAECDLIYQHVGDYFNNDDKPRRRDLPGEAVRVVESFLGNTAISQWHARNASLTVLEEMQASRRFAA